MTVIITVTRRNMNRQKTRERQTLDGEQRMATRPAGPALLEPSKSYGEGQEVAEESYTHSVKPSDCEVLPCGEDLVIDIGASDPATFRITALAKSAISPRPPAGYLPGIAPLI
jgi:hypothetical protein